MDTITKGNEIVLLFDKYTDDGSRLHISFDRAGISHKVLLLDSDGFEPDGVESIYSYFTGDYSQAKDAPGKPLYFNQVPIPEYWDIRGNGSSAEIYNYENKMASIYYTLPRHKRLVRLVEWVDSNKVVRCSDHYNKYGFMFARTTFNRDGEKVNKSIFANDGTEVVVENYVTNDITVNYNGKILMFKNKTMVAKYIIENMGYDKGHIFYNSLSFPFFISDELHSEEKCDALFWQENTGKSIPGNMQIILNGNSTRTKAIFVQRKESYEKLIGLGASKEYVKSLGFIYPFEKDNNGEPQALICTNSDEILKLQEIVEALPEMHFHIAAVTEMSSKLLGFDSYDNVTLYPNVKNKVLERLFNRCDFYIDINKYNEIVDSMYRAFLHNHIIFAFKETMHNEFYTADINVFEENDWEAMVDSIKMALKNAGYRRAMIEEQKKKSMSESVENYLKAMEDFFS